MSYCDSAHLELVRAERVAVALDHEQHGRAGRQPRVQHRAIPVATAWRMTGECLNHSDVTVAASPGGPRSEDDIEKGKPSHRRAAVHARTATTSENGTIDAGRTGSCCWRRRATARRGSRRRPKRSARSPSRLARSTTTYAQKHARAQDATHTLIPIVRLRCHARRREKKRHKPEHPAPLERRGVGNERSMDLRTTTILNRGDSCAVV